MLSVAGAVGISTAKNSNISKMYLVDISSNALEVTKKNILLNNIKEKCEIYESDLLSNIEDKILQDIDIILCNPPYIASCDIEVLSEYVKNEPMLALDGGIDGMDIYSRFLKEFNDKFIKLNIKKEIYILFEIGFDEKDKLINLTKKCDIYEYIECIKDLNSLDRVVILKTKCI